MGGKPVVEAYIRSIRNTAKRKYAIEYLQWIAGDMRDDAPIYEGRSSMGAQAVRMKLRELIEG